MTTDAYIQIKSFPNKVHSPEELVGLLNGAAGCRDAQYNPCIQFEAGEVVPFERVVNTLNDFVKYRWLLNKANIDHALGALKTLRNCLQESQKSNSWNESFWLLFYSQAHRYSEIKQKEESFQRVKDLFDYATAERQKRGNLAETIYLRPCETNQDRAFSISPEGTIIVYLNRKRKYNDDNLGFGSYKTVTFARDIEAETVYASAGYQELNPRDLYFLKKFKGIPGFVQLIDYFYYRKNDDLKCRVVMELCKYGNLDDAIFVKRGRLTPADKKNIFILLIRYVAEMHRMGLIHRDLKFANILLHRKRAGHPLSPVIGDFGSMTEMSEEIHRKYHETTPIMASPEYAEAYFSTAKDRDEQILKATTPNLDNWGLGCILCYLLELNELPWISNENVEYFSEIHETMKKAHGNWFPEPAPNTPAHLVYELLVDRITSQQAEQRLREINLSLDHFSNPQR